jgi:hypothetical protein
VLEAVLNLQVARTPNPAFLGVAILFFILASAAPAQMSVAGPIQPGPVTLQLRTANGQSQFHRGEVVRLELVFSSAERRAYSIPEECTPRETYRYSISPPALDRAVEVDAAMSMFFGNCHGFSSQADPGEKPIVLRQILNDRYRIEIPGTYSVSVKSNKLGFPLNSNALQIEVLPSDASWEQSEFERANALLAERYGSETWEEGCEVLRYLETPQAEVEMARREGKQMQPCDFDIPLISARHRKLVQDQLEKGVNEPGRVIRGDYLRVLAFLSLYQQHPEWYPALATEGMSTVVSADSSGAAGQGFQPSGLWSHGDMLRAEAFRYARLLAAALDKKTPGARSQSLETLLYLGDTWPGSEVPADLLALVRREMPGAFADLPPSDRDAVLLHQWDEIKSPAMLPVLQDLVVQPQGLGSNGIALIRLNELSPEDARPIILGQLRSPNPQGGVAALSLLAEEQLPDLDTLLLHRLMEQQGDGAIAFEAGLLRRYASAAIAPELKPWFSERIGKTYCGTEAELLAYFLRVAPADGAAMLRAAMKSDSSGCLVLRRLAPIYFSPEVEREALAALDDSGPEVVQEALQVLRDHAAASSREILLQHFQKWHERWSGHEGELASANSANQAGVESAYSEAIGLARNWLSTAADWRELQKLCVTKDCQERDQQIIVGLGSPFPPMIGLYPAVGDEFRESYGLDGCQRCSLEQIRNKMLQYPAAAKFLLDARSSRRARIQRVFAELQPWAAAHGFALQLYPK